MINCAALARTRLTGQRANAAWSMKTPGNREEDPHSYTQLPTKLVAGKSPNFKWGAFLQLCLRLHW